MRARLIIFAFIIAFVLGLTATVWNPITRAYDQMTTSWETATHQGQRVDDSATADPEIDWDGIENYAAESCEHLPGETEYEECWVEVVDEEAGVTLTSDDYAVSDSGVYYLTKEG